jgi:hypothetical protein
MMRSAADLDTPNSGASWRIVKFVRLSAATSTHLALQRQPLATQRVVANLPN